jgi:phospholipid/cholesterol/gamma-HCH transport system substrate-binding protein
MVNIQVAKGVSPLVKTDDFLTTQKFVGTDEMLQTLSKTNNNIFAITQALKTTVYRLDTSAILNFLNDKNIELSVTSSLKNINGASSDARDITAMLKAIVAQIKQGKGAAGVLLTDTGFANSIKAAGAKLNLASDNINHATAQLTNITTGVSNDLSYGKGPLHALLRDSVITQKIDTSMQHVEQSSEGLNQIITALKHNFLVRGYFKRQAKQEMKEKQKKDSIK